MYNTSLVSGIVIKGDLICGVGGVVGLGWEGRNLNHSHQKTLALTKIFTQNLTILLDENSYYYPFIDPCSKL